MYVCIYESNGKYAIYGAKLMVKIDVVLWVQDLGFRTYFIYVFNRSYVMCHLWHKIVTRDWYVFLSCV